MKFQNKNYQKSRRILLNMYHEENLGKYFNNLRRIFRSKLELLDYYEQVVRYQELEKKASFSETSIFYLKIYCLFTLEYFRIFGSNIR